MKPSPCGTISTLLSIFFVLFFSCATAQPHSPHFSTCPDYPPSPWWDVLRDQNGRDPCALLASLELDVKCCMKGSGMPHSGHHDHHHSHDDDDDGQQPCGSICTLQNYNMASACGACYIAQNATLGSLEGIGPVRGVPPLMAWTKSKSDPGNSTTNTTLPSWTNEPIKPQDSFQIGRVLQAAALANSTPSLAPPAIPFTSISASFSAPTSTSGNIPISATGNTSTSTMGEKSTSSTSGALTSPSPPSTDHVGAVVGGVVGGIAFFTLIAIGVFCFLRRRERRRKLNYAPSAEFWPAIASQPTSGNQMDPPAFSPGAWKDPVLEKSYGGTMAQRDLDAGAYVNSWRLDLEKS